MGAKRTARQQAGRWLQQGVEVLEQQWHSMRRQLGPTEWPERCARLLQVADSEVGDWRPKPGSSSAELLLLLQGLSLLQRRWLAVLLDAPSAGVHTLTEAVERLQLDWRSRLDPLQSHREYARQLLILAQQLNLSAAAEAAYLENERQIFLAVEQRLLLSLPMRLRMTLARQLEPGSGACLRWWHERLLARAGVPGYDLAGLGEHDWPEIPAAWLALGWLAGLRRES